MRDRTPFGRGHQGVIEMSDEPFIETSSAIPFGSRTATPTSHEPIVGEFVEDGEPAAADPELFEGQVVSEKEKTDPEYEVLRESNGRGRGTLKLRHGVTLDVRPLKPAAAPTPAPSPSAPLETSPKTAVAGAGDARDLVVRSDDPGLLPPGRRHRRRLILNWLKNLTFDDCLDAGCGRPHLLHSIVERRRAQGRPVEGCGCDISAEMIRANQPDPLGCTLLPLDLTQQTWPGDRKFDLVVCADVLEEVTQWRKALANLVRMTRRYLLITVPAGPIRTLDRLAGHRQHFDGLELAGAIVGHGLTILRQRRWGFPVHSLYQSALSGLGPEKVVHSYAAGHHSITQRLVSEGLYYAFFSNDLFHGGGQQMLLARRG